MTILPDLTGLREQRHRYNSSETSHNYSSINEIV